MVYHPFYWEKKGTKWNTFLGNTEAFNTNNTVKKRWNNNIEESEIHDKNRAYEVKCKCNVTFV